MAVKRPRAPFHPLYVLLTVGMFGLLVVLTIAVGWSGSAYIPLFGLGLSAALSLLVFMLLGRMAAYRAAEQRYHGVFDSTSDGLFVLDGDGRVLEANPAAAEMYGYGIEDLVGIDVQRLIAEGHKHKLDQFLWGIREHGTVDVTSVNVRPDGSTFPIEVRGTRVLHEGKPAFLAVVRDVTGRDAAMQRQVKVSHKILVAQEEERSRVSRDLHDGLGQLLTALRLELDWMATVDAVGPQAVAFIQATSLIDEAVAELRGICRGLRPPLLDDMGLEPAVRQLVEGFHEQTDLPVDLDLRFPEGDAVPMDVALCTYRVLQEALTNINRHAEANRVGVSLRGRDAVLELTVIDDGVGFDLQCIPGTPGFGIAGMQERAKLASGTIEIRSETMEGTRVDLRLPLDPMRPEERA